ncbi:MAG: hypothetical protein FJW38_18090 [Acidobacteria bacterium]|nr:hypothetical protein [Acidobacteriota bacterium]
MTAQSIEDRLREEYGLLLPAMKLVCFELETRVRHKLLPVIRTLKPYEKIEISARVKECESAIPSLRKRQQGAQFDRERSVPYSLTELKDLAGVRVGVFPRTRMDEVDRVLREEFGDWAAKHVPGIQEESELPLALKYHGRCSPDSEVFGEYQVMPLMTKLYWGVQHAAVYKGDARIARKLERHESAVLKAMRQFEEEFERLLLQEQALHGPE